MSLQPSLSWTIWGVAVVDTHHATLEPGPRYASGKLGQVQVGVRRRGQRGSCPRSGVRQAPGSLPLPGCETLNQGYNHSKPQLSHLKNRNNNSTLCKHIGLLWKVQEITPSRHLVFVLSPPLHKSITLSTYRECLRLPHWTGRDCAPPD